jgi:hypothetical protein
VLFAILATANAGGYRFGVSDQAFYIPVIVRALDPSAFPRDAPLIDAQGQLMLADQALAGLVRATGIPLDYLFLGGYVLSLALIWIGIVLIGDRLYRSRWTTLALGLAFTLRHRIARTSANSLEPYFHPRMLAFGICLLAVAAVLRRQSWLAIGLVALSSLVHITTALWFAVLLGVAIVILDRRVRVPAAVLAVVALLAAGVAVRFGAFTDRLVHMDAAWLEAVASKDSLFATQWPLWTWVVNLGLLALLLAMHQRRMRRRQDTVESTALVWGACALVLLFVVTLPLVAWRLAFPVQLQISRVFWLVDFLATAWLIGEIADTSEHRARIAVAVIALFAAARGAYGLGVEHQDRSLAAVHLPVTPWHDAMAWLQRQPRDIHVVADPGHAWKYGTSVRVSAERDVFLEEQKDSAIAMYSRDVAVRVVERIQAIGDFNTLTAERANELSARYDIDYVVTEAPIPSLREVYRNQQFHIYEVLGARP